MDHDFGLQANEVINNLRKAKKMSKEILVNNYSVHFNFNTKDELVALDITSQIEEIINNNREKLSGYSIHTDSSSTRY
jgi:hypothetical protein